MRVKFHVWDACNKHCTDCHWFSDHVSFVAPPLAEAYLQFLARNPVVTEVVFTGGEPTLWPELERLLRQLPVRLTVFVYTNGIIPIQTCRDNVHVMRHREFVPGHVGDQLYAGKRWDFLVGQEVVCRTREIRIATDGYAYCCEVGLRSKAQELRESLSLWTGEVTPPQARRCCVRVACTSAFGSEQTIMQRHKCHQVTNPCVFCACHKDAVEAAKCTDCHPRDV